MWSWTYLAHHELESVKLLLLLQLPCLSNQQPDATVCYDDFNVNLCCSLRFWNHPQLPADLQADPGITHARFGFVLCHKSLLIPAKNCLLAKLAGIVISAYGELLCRMLHC